MTTQHLEIPLQPYTEPQRRWLKRSASTIDRYLDTTYGDDREGRSLDAMFLRLAADVIWEVAPDAPGWHRLSVLTLLVHLANAPTWDEAFLLHACAALAAFYRWLERHDSVAPHEVGRILDDLDRRMAETLASLGVSPSSLVV